MAGERKAIRDSVKDALSAVYAGSIYTSRIVDARDLDQYVNVFLESGETEQEDLDEMTTAALVVGYHIKDLVSDDELDAVGDQLAGAVTSAAIAPDVIRGILPAGFEYDNDQEQEFTSLFLQFSVTY